MRLKSYIQEKRSKNVIVVDVQPYHKDHIHFDLYKFTDFLNRNRNILYFFNGEDVGVKDTKKSILSWLHQYGNYNSNITFVDKYYGFFRSWMDNGIDEATIQKVVRYMVMNRIDDSRNIPDDVFYQILPKDQHYTIFYKNDPIYIPDFITISNLRKWKGSYLVGGGAYECLKEIQILLNTFNISYTLVKEFIY